MIRRQIIDEIKAYAEAYARFQALQDENPNYLPVGDQKTGVIGEFFGLLFARSAYPSATAVYAEPSKTGWDLEVSGNASGPDVKIQVKTVSAYSKKRNITPLYPGWDQLYLVYLGRHLLPEGFWIVTDTGIFRGRSSLRGLAMRNPGNPRSGSKYIPWGENRVAELLRVSTMQVA